ncbi:hypothetical protein LTR27_001000 [Elasticomyces elasticus]|nr:hypothetical protein LTR27_001000 [Elasticomyces elasticus]
MHFNTAIITAAVAIFSSAAFAAVLPPSAEVVFPNATVAGNTTSCSEECRSVREAYEADEGHANKTLAAALDSCIEACEFDIKFGHMTISEILLESIWKTDELQREIFKSQLENMRRQLDFMELAYARMASTASRDKRCGLLHKVSSALLDWMLLDTFSLAAEQLASVIRGAASATQPSDDSGVEASNAQPDEEVAKKEVENKATL